MRLNTDSHTKTVYLLGSPVAHSISPQIHNHAFNALGLPFVYTALDVSPENLHDTVNTLRTSMLGANVTIPHKEAALGFCDELSQLSMITGTVNTLYMSDEKLCGTTTDPAGFYKALESDGHVFGNDDVVILGSGGTAKTLGAALLLDKKCKSLIVAARSVDKARALALSLKKIGGSAQIGYCVMNQPDRNNIDTFARCTLLVNCTSAGMYPDTDSTPLNKKYFHPNMTVFDAIYNPNVTRFLREAAEAGCKTKNGLLMLLYQGLESFCYWTGVNAPAELFTEELLQAFVSGKSV